MKCPKCQHENPDTGKFCEECGTQLIPLAEILPKKRCGICEEIIEKGLLACPKCGSGIFETEKQHADPIEYNQTSVHKNQKKIIRTLIKKSAKFKKVFLLLLVLIMPGLVFLFPDHIAILFVYLGLLTVLTSTVKHASLWYRLDEGFAGCGVIIIGALLMGLGFFIGEVIAPIIKNDSFFHKYFFE